MNKKLKKELKAAFNAPTPTRKLDFLMDFPYPEANMFEFVCSQISYIRKRFWILSICVVITMLTCAEIFDNGYKTMVLLSTALPLLTLIGVVEINKSLSHNMQELEMSCKYSLGKIILIRLSAIGSFQFIVLLTLLIPFTTKTNLGFLRNTVYIITPFLLCSYLSLFITNHLKTKDTIYICGVVTGFISICTFILTTNIDKVYASQFIIFWNLTFILMIGLIGYEICKLMRRTEELQWNSRLTA